MAPYYYSISRRRWNSKPTVASAFCVSNFTIKSFSVLNITLYTLYVYWLVGKTSLKVLCRGDLLEEVAIWLMLTKR